MSVPSGAGFKAGFRPLEEREPDHEHRDRWLLMEFDRAGAAP